VGGRSLKCEQVNGEFRAWPGLLDGHCDAESFLCADVVIGVLSVVADIDLDPADPSRELGLCDGEIVGDGRRCVAAEGGGLVEGEDHRHGGIDSYFADGFAVDEEGCGAALAVSAAVVIELECPARALFPPSPSSTTANENKKVLHHI
jgi:hypothetical protein